MSSELGPNEPLTTSQKRKLFSASYYRTIVAFVKLFCLKYSWLAFFSIFNTGLFRVSFYYRFSLFRM